MTKYIATYRAVIEAEDMDDAEIISIDLEGDIKSLQHVKNVDCDPYLEEME